MISSFRLFSSSCLAYLAVSSEDCDRSILIGESILSLCFADFLAVYVWRNGRGISLLVSWVPGGGGLGSLLSEDWASSSCFVSPSSLIWSLVFLLGSLMLAASSVS